MAGKVDLLMGEDGRLEMLDFKTSPKPVDSSELLASYERQLCTYAHILEERHQERVECLFLYWTAEARKQEAVMALSYRPERFEEAGRHFDAVVENIRAKDFRIITPPESGICKECDLRSYCVTEGSIR